MVTMGLRSPNERMSDRRIFPCPDPVSTLLSLRRPRLSAETGCAFHLTDGHERTCGVTCAQQGASVTGPACARLVTARCSRRTRRPGGSPTSPRDDASDARRVGRANSGTSPPGVPARRKADRRECRSTPLRCGLPLGQHRHGGVVAVQPLGREHMRFDQGWSGRERRGAGADLVGERRQAELDAFTVSDRSGGSGAGAAELLENHRQQARAGQPAGVAWNGAGGCVTASQARQAKRSRTVWITFHRRGIDLSVSVMSSPSFDSLPAAAGAAHGARG